MAKDKEQNQTPEYKRVLSYYNTFCTEAGKAVFKDLLAMFYDTSGYASGDTGEVIYHEGQRSVVQHIISALRQSKHPEMFERNLDDFIKEEEFI